MSNICDGLPSIFFGRPMCKICQLGIPWSLGTCLITSAGKQRPVGCVRGVWPWVQVIAFPSYLLWHCLRWESRGFLQTCFAQSQAAGGGHSLPLFLPFLWQSSPSLSCPGAEKGLEKRKVRTLGERSKDVCRVRQQLKQNCLEGEKERKNCSLAHLSW